MEFEKPKEDLPHFKTRVAAIEKRRHAATFYLIIAIPFGAIAIILLIANLFGFRGGCLLIFLGVISICFTAGSLYLYYHFKQAEEFEEKRRSERIREFNGTAKCIYLDGKVPDGSGKIGKCVLYGFTLDELPFCIYCGEYRPRKE